MSITEIKALMKTVDSDTLATAKRITKTIMNIKGGKWDGLTLLQRVCILAALCIKYGEGRKEHATTGSK